MSKLNESLDFFAIFNKDMFKYGLTKVFVPEVTSFCLKINGLKLIFDDKEQCTRRNCLKKKNNRAFEKILKMKQTSWS